MPIQQLSPAEAAAQNGVEGVIYQSTANPAVFWAKGLTGRLSANPLSGGLSAAQAAAVADTYVSTIDEVLAGIERSKLEPVNLIIAPGTYVFPFAKINLEGVVSLTMDCPSKKAIFTKATLSGTPQEFFYTPSTTTLGFGHIRCHGVEFNGHWNRTTGYLADAYGTGNVSVSRTSFRLYGLSTDTFEVDWCTFKGLQDLTFVIFNAGLVRATRCESYRCMDMGAVNIDRVEYYANQSFYSQDNAYSISRRCRNVNISMCRAFGALTAFWVAGYNDGSGMQHAPRSVIVSLNEADTCLHGVLGTDGLQNFVISNNTLRNIGYQATSDNPTGDNPGVFLDTTLASDAASGATSITVTDGTLASVNGYFVIQAGAENLSHVRQITAKATNVLSFTEPLPEAIAASPTVRVMYASWVNSSGSGVGIGVSGTLTSPYIPCQDGVITGNIITGFRAAGINLIFSKSVLVSGNKISRPRHTGSGVLAGISISDNNGPTALTDRLRIYNNEINMRSPVDVTTTVPKYGIYYPASAGTLVSGTPPYRHQLIAKENWFEGVLENNEFIAPGNLYGAMPVQWYDEWGMSQTGVQTDTVTATGTMALFDFGRKETLNVGHTVANGTALTDILGLFTTATVVVSGDGAAVHDIDNRNLTLTATTGLSYIEFGSNIGIGTPRQYLVIFWVRLTSLGLSTTSSDEGNAILSLSDTGPNRSLQIRVNEQSPSPGTLNISAWWDNTGQSPAITSLSSAYRFTQHQIAISYEISGGNATSKVFIDGAVVSTHTRADIVQQNTGANTLKLGCGAGAANLGGTIRPNMKIYRVLVEDLAVSARNPATVVTADYAAAFPKMYGKV